MFVREINLFNVRSFKQAKISFGKGINLLVGANNSGKSTILRAIYKLQDNNSLKNDDIRKPQESSRIIIDLDEIKSADAKLFTVKQKGNAPAPTLSPIKVVFNSHTDSLDNKLGVERVWINIDTPHKQDELGRITFPNNTKNVTDISGFTDFYGLPNIETKDNFIYPFFAKRKVHSYNNQSLGSKDSFSVSEDLRTITSKIQKIANPSHPKYEEFIRYTKDILGFTLGVIPNGENESNVGIFVTGTTVIPIDQMGEGVVNIMGLLVLLLTEDYKLYLIEEPENDIHPEALKKLLAIILEKSTNNQFIISTHSHIVVKYLGNQPGKIFKISWTPFEEIKSVRIPTSTVTEVDDSPISKLTLLQALGYELFDFDLFQSYLIFEESSAESIVRVILMPMFTPKLMGRIKTISASGTSDLKAKFHALSSLFLYVHGSPIYFSKAWVCADGDDSGKETIISLRNKFSSWPEDNFVYFSQPNFEYYYPEAFQWRFNEIKKLKDRTERQNSKIQLTVDLLNWIKEDPERAKHLFAHSAAEIIQILKRIEKRVLGSND